MAINYNQLKGKVEYILQSDEASRNSDTRLYNKLITTYPRYIEHLILLNGKYVIPLEARYNLPKEEDVARIRRKFNSQGKYKATSQDVLDQRNKLEKEWRNEMMNDNPSRG